MSRTRPTRRPSPARLLVALVALAAARPAAAQTDKEHNQPLNTSALPGQSVPVLPLTLLVSDRQVVKDSAYAPWRGVTTGNRRADSLLGEVILAREPEVKWILPPELRQVAKRGAGFVPDPDRMGQAILRMRVEKVPDPLASALRNLTAVAGGRYAFVPSALSFARDSASGGVTAVMWFSLVDSRRDKVLWRTIATGTAATPDEAFLAALDHVFPPPTLAP